MRVACAVILVLSITTSAGAESLAPGKPAGTHQAQSVATVGTAVLGAAAAFGLLLALESGGAAKITSSTPAINAANAAVNEGAALNTTP